MPHTFASRGSTPYLAASVPSPVRSLAAGLGPAARLALAALCGAGALGASGCANVSGTTALAEVRIIDTSPDAQALDIYEGTTVLAYDVGFGSLTSYIPITPGSYTVVADQAGSKSQVISAGGTFAAGGQYTVLLGNYSNALKELILTDQSSASPAGQVNLRFLDQSVRSGNLDLYLIPKGATITTLKPVVSAASFGTNTGYVGVPAGTYTLVALPAGTVPTATGSTSYTGSAVTYTAGSASTVVLLDPQLTTTPGVQVILADDFDPPGTV